MSNSKTNSMMRNHVRPIFLGLTVGILGAWLEPSRRQALRVVPPKTSVMSAASFNVMESPHCFLVLPFFSVLYSWGISAFGVLLIPRRLADGLETRDVSKGEASLASSFAILIVIAIGVLIYEHSFEWELDRLVKPLHGYATTWEAYPGYVSIGFRRTDEQNQNLPKIRDADLERIVEIALRADRQSHWKLIRLDLSNTNVTDDGLKYLDRLPDQIGVSLLNSSVTEEGVQRYLEKRPKMHIYWKVQSPQQIEE